MVAQLSRRALIAGAGSVAAGAGVDPAIGHDAWVEVVERALAGYVATQHLIGTYNDGLIHGKDTGWRIDEMMLEAVSGDRRTLGR